MRSDKAENKQNLIFFKSAETPKNRDIDEFKGRNLIIGCGGLWPFLEKACIVLTINNHKDNNRPRPPFRPLV